MCSEPCLCSEGGESCSFFYSCLYDIKLDFVHFVVSWITCFASIFLNLFFLSIYPPIFSLLSSLTKKGCYSLSIYFKPVTCNYVS